MIILFSKLCKCFKQISFENEVNIFDEYMKSINIDDLICPFCGANNASSPFASYKRHLVTYDNGKRTIKDGLYNYRDISMISL